MPRVTQYNAKYFIFPVCIQILFCKVLKIPKLATKGNCFHLFLSAFYQLLQDTEIHRELCSLPLSKDCKWHKRLKFSVCVLKVTHTNTNTCKVTYCQNYVKPKILLRH